MITGLAQTLEEDLPRWQRIHPSLHRRPHHKGVNACHCPAVAISLCFSHRPAERGAIHRIGRWLHQWVHVDHQMLIVRLQNAHIDYMTCLLYAS